jgi:hypothetical protein
MFQQVIAIIRGVVFTSEATQSVTVLWMYLCMDYNLSNVASCRRMRPRVASLDNPPDNGNDLLKHVEVKFGIHK